MSSVQVAVRTRPFSQREVESGSGFCIEMKGNSAVIYKSGAGKRRSGSGAGSGGGQGFAKEFVFDHSYWSVCQDDEHYVDQKQVFQDLGVPVLESAFQGYNACVFAYGQTGSGKTHTMMGSEGALGLIPRICEGLFAWMSGEKVEQGEQVSYKNEVSYMEIYNEKVRDLLQDMPIGKGGQQLHQLRVREHPKEGPYVEDLSRHSVEDYAAILSLIQLGNTHRVTASTRMNNASSRSHAIFTIKFTQAKYVCGLPGETVSKIHLVDLAGSERASATGAEGDRLKEGGNINRSLVCLGTVISALADMSGRKVKAGGGAGKKAFIPYRDSVLTWLLKDSLGGNSKTIMVATISPADSSYGETLSTLRYASRAKNIVNEPTVNEDPNVKLIHDLRAEIQRLKSIITTGSTESIPRDHQRLQKSASISLAEDIYKKEEQVAELTRKWAGKWTDIQRIVEEHHLALRSEGVKMVVDSMQPHFVGVDSDILSTGLVFYYLKDGTTTIGAGSESYLPDINIPGSDLDREHCQVTWEGHRVMLHPLSEKCYVNHRRVDEAVELCQGDLLQLGEFSVLRFNHPHEAQKLREQKQNDILLGRDSPPSPHSPYKAHTLPRRKKRRITASSSSPGRCLVDQAGRESPVFKSCAMKVEHEASSSRRRKTKSSVAVSLSPGSFESDVEPSKRPSSAEFSDFSSSSAACTPNLSVSEFYHDTSEVCSLNVDALVSPGCLEMLPEESSEGGGGAGLLMKVLSPVLLFCISLLVLPLYLFLAVLLFVLARVFGLSRNSWLLKPLSLPLSLLAVLMVTPVASLCHLLFGTTQDFLLLVGPRTKRTKQLIQ